jgi:hypothetical protein
VYRLWFLRILLGIELMEHPDTNQSEHLVALCLLTVSQY